MIKKIKYVIQEFWSFLKYPHIENTNKVGFFYYLIGLGIVEIVAAILSVGILFLFGTIDLPVIQHDTSGHLEPIPYMWSFLFAVLITPFVEELSFRYPLKYKKNSLFIAFSVLFIISSFTNNYAIRCKILNIPIDFDYREFVFRLLWYIAFILLIFVVTRFDKVNKILSKFWDRYLIVIIYVLAGYFAYLHFSLPQTGINWIWLPAMVLPQFFSALYFSYIRLKVKFSYCVFLHMILNGVALFPGLFDI